MPGPIRPFSQTYTPPVVQKKLKKSKEGAASTYVLPTLTGVRDNKNFNIRPEYLGVTIQSVTQKKGKTPISAHYNESSWILAALVELGRNFGNYDSPADQLQVALKQLIQLIADPEFEAETPNREEYIRNEIQRMFKKSIRKEWDEIQYNIMRDWQDSPPPPGSLGDKMGIVRLNLDVQLELFKRLEKALEAFNIRMKVNQEILKQQ